MAKLTDLTTLAKTSVGSADYFLVTNSTSKQSNKLTVASIFPSLVTAGSGSENIWVSITNKNQLNFKGLKSDTTSNLTVTTTSNNLILSLVEAGIDLNACDNTSSVFMTGVDFTKTVTSACPVINGGTGLATIAKGAILYASAADTIAATAVPSNNADILTFNSSSGIPAWTTIDAGDNIILDRSVAGVLTLDASLSSMAAILDMANYNIDLGTGWISADGATSQGIKVTAAKAFIGVTGSHHTTDTLNLSGGGIALGNDTAAAIRINSTAGTTVGRNLTIQGGGSDNATAGDLHLKAGDAGSGNNNGGDLKIYGGNDYGAGTAGDVEIHAYNGSGSSVQSLSIVGGVSAPDVTINSGNLVITAADKGIIHTNSGIVTQATNHTTAVTINSTSGVITLAAVALAATTNAEFVVTNSTCQTNSVILVTMQDENTVDNKQLACAIHTVADGAFTISIVNPHSATVTSATASKIHFLIVNPN